MKRLLILTLVLAGCQNTDFGPVDSKVPDELRAKLMKENEKSNEELEADYWASSEGKIQKSLDELHETINKKQAELDQSVNSVRAEGEDFNNMKAVVVSSLLPKLSQITPDVWVSPYKEKGIRIVENIRASLEKAKESETAEEFNVNMQECRRALNELNLVMIDYVKSNEKDIEKKKMPNTVQTNE